jgi:3-methylcrotonyl-CoA carboxylase alpha subunit
MSDDVWRAAGAWRIARGGMPFRFRAGDRLLSATVERDEQVNGWQIEVEGETVTITADPLGDHGVLLRRGEETISAQVVRDGERLLVQLDGRAYTLTREPAPNVEAAEASGSGESAHGQIAAPMPAKVVKVLVRPGERVKPHQTLVVLESMKIEHLVEAPYAAVVERVRCRAGEVVPEGAVLVDLEAQ